MIHQLKIDLDASMYTGFFKALGDSFTVGLIGDVFTNVREVILVVGVLDMGQQLCPFAYPIHAEAK